MILDERVVRLNKSALQVMADQRSIKPRNESADVKLSKALSYVLRHGASKEKLPIGNDGYIEVAVLLKNSRFQNYKFSDIQRIVKDNDKQRFTLTQIDDTIDSSDPSAWKIRANQGHSLGTIIDLELDPLTNLSQFPEIVVHGTNLQAWSSIKSKGISKMRRNHIHLAPGLPQQGSVISGARSSSTVFIYIDIAKALKSGIEFFRSSNEVILTTGDKNGFILPEYFLKVEDRTGNDLLIL